MYTVVLQTCKSHEQIWENIPAFANAVANLTAKLDEFTTTAEKRLVDTTHITQKKLSMIDDLHEKVYSIVKLIRAYAASVDDEPLAMEYSINKRSLTEGGAKATINRFSNVVTKATEMISELEDFGLTPQFLQALTQDVEEAKMVIWEPRLKIIQRKAQTRKLEALIDEMDDIVFVQLTGMVELLQFEQPAFHAAFFDARNIIDLKGKRRTDQLPPTPGVNDSD